jgi:hypothetical protein
MAFRSQLEQAVSSKLTRAGIVANHEAHTLPVMFTIQTQPDFWLPELGIVVEAKGKVANHFEFVKLVSTSNIIADGVTFDDVKYTRYIVAVQVNPGELKQYAAVLGDVNKLVRTLPRGNFPLTGLRLLAALHRSNVNVVPVTYGSLGFLMHKLDVSKGRVRT